MTRSSSSLWLDIGLLGTAALVASVSVSFALEPVVAGELLLPQDPIPLRDAAPDLPSFDGAARDRLSELTGVPLNSAFAITSTHARSALPFLVVGTLVSRNSAHAIAVLFNPQTRGGVIVRIGDSLEDAVVTAIEHRRVTVHRYGRDEVLEPLGRSRPVGETAIHAVAPDRIQVPRQVIVDATADIHRIGQSAFFSPTVFGGRAVFRIDRIREGSLFEQLGLQNGDVLVSIDDIPIQRLDELIAHYPSLSSARSVRVEIARDGQIQRRTYEIAG